MGEVERIRPSFGASFGHDLGPRITSLGDRRSKKHDHEEPEHSQEDAIELHDDSLSESKTPIVHLTVESTDHLDLSA